MIWVILIMVCVIILFGYKPNKLRESSISPRASLGSLSDLGSIKITEQMNDSKTNTWYGSVLGMDIVSAVRTIPFEIKPKKRIRTNVRPAYDRYFSNSKFL